MRVKNLLVTGRPGSGKTTLIESVVQKYAGDAGGFYTREIREHGVRKGFSIVTLDGETGILAHVDVNSPVRVSKYGVDVKALESVAVRALRRAVEGKKVAVIDEIGRMEMASEEFWRSVLEALASDCIVLATIQQHPHPFTDAIKRRADTRVFQLTSENRGAVREAIQGILEELLISR
jgi:nucleoside-triphosphatase